MVLSLEETPALQPRPRPFPTRPAPPHNRPTRLEHASTRAGALNLLAALDTPSGQVYGPCDDRTRQAEGIALLDHVDRELPDLIQTIHLVCDHVSTPHGPEGTRGIAKQPRFIVHVTPGHGSWMKHVEHWCRIVQRKHLRMVDCPTPEPLCVQRAQLIRAGHQQAHPFHWSVKSVAKVMAAAPARAA